MSADEPESHAGSRRPPGAGAIRVAVAGAAGRMGQTVCAAVEGADDMELTGRADPALGTAGAAALISAAVRAAVPLGASSLRS